jgi:hypothetical protein
LRYFSTPNTFKALLKPEYTSTIPHTFPRFGLCALLHCYTSYLNSSDKSISRIFLAPEVLQTINSINTCILERVLVFKQQNDFLFSGGGEKRDFVQKSLGSVHGIIRAIVRRGLWSSGLGGLSV